MKYPPSCPLLCPGNALLVSPSHTHILLSPPHRPIVPQTDILSSIPSPSLSSVPAEAPDLNELTGKCQISSPFIPVWCDISVGQGRLCRLAYTATTAGVVENVASSL